MKLMESINKQFIKKTFNIFSILFSLPQSGLKKSLNKNRKTASVSNFNSSSMLGHGLISLFTS